MRKQTVSAVIITLNEEADIRRCLESVRWANEIIVVDSGSTDRTLDICKEYGCRVFSHEWEGYAGQKNFAASLASCNWVLNIDGDEEITPELAKEIKATVNSGADAAAYLIPRRNQFLDQWMCSGGWYPDMQLRLFRCGAGKFKDVPLHERLVLNDPKARIGKLKNDMLHHSYATVSDFIRRADRYTDIEADARLAGSRVPKYPALSLVTAFPRKFTEMYIYKGGWRDGVHGLMATTLMSSRVFLRHVKVWHRLLEQNGSLRTDAPPARRPASGSEPITADAIKRTKTISVVIITLNEEANIRRALESVKWADEIVVVDSGSTDRTMEICEEYGCRTMVHTWTADGAQKNYAMDKATMDWVLSLDADEVVSPELAIEMLRAIESPDAPDAFLMPRRNSFLGRWMKHGGWYPDAQLRLLKRNAGRWTIRISHSHIELEPGLRAGRLRNDLIHYTYPSVHEVVRKADRFSTKESGDMLAKNRIPRALTFKLITAFPVKFAETYIYKGGWRDGIHGLVASTLTATRVFARYAKIWHGLRNG